MTVVVLSRGANALLYETMQGELNHTILTERKSIHFLENTITKVNSSFPVLSYNYSHKLLYKIISVVSRKRNDSS